MCVHFKYELCYVLCHYKHLLETYIENYYHILLEKYQYKHFWGNDFFY